MQAHLRRRSRPPDNVRSTHRWIALIYASVVIGEMLWVLSLPVFPSQDGPAHVYFADVTARVWSGSSAFSGNYEIAHKVSPYALQTYLLIPLIRIFGAVWAEKILVCIIVAVTAAGMRLFAMRLGDSGDVIALLATPFLLNNFLFMGFYNYCLALGLALVAAGIWSGGSRERTSLRATFVALSWLAALAHPVGFGLLIAYGGTLLIIGAIATRASQWTTDIPNPRMGDVIALALAAAPLIYIAGFVSGSERSLRNSTFALALQQGYDWGRLVIFAGMGYVSPIAPWMFRFVLMAVALTLTVAAAAVTFDDLRAHRLRLASFVLLFGVILVLAIPAFPSLVNGYGFYFAERLAIVATLLLIAAASNVELGERKPIVVAIGVMLAIFAVATLNHDIRPMARLLVASDPAPAAGMKVMMIDGAPFAAPAGLSFDPCRIAGVRLIHAANAVWVNTPAWLNSSILMLHQTRQFTDTDYDEMLRRGELTIVVVHCGATNAPVVRETEERYQGAMTIARGAYADVLRPTRKP